MIAYNQNMFNKEDLVNILALVDRSPITGGEARGVALLREKILSALRGLDRPIASSIEKKLS
jgi:hypothetical protein